MTIQRVSVAFSFYISNFEMYLMEDDDHALFNSVREGKKCAVLRLKFYRTVIVVMYAKLNIWLWMILMAYSLSDTIC